MKRTIPTDVLLVYTRFTMIDVITAMPSLVVVMTMMISRLERLSLRRMM
jgi:hypothetical protein